MKLKIYLVCFCIIKVILAADESNPMPSHFHFGARVCCRSYELCPATLSTSCKTNFCVCVGLCGCLGAGQGVQDQEGCSHRQMCGGNMLVREGDLNA